MASLKVYILFCVIFVFTLFNFNWGITSFYDIESIPDVCLFQSLDDDQEDVNSEAVSIGSKILKYSSSQHDGFYSGDIFSEYKIFKKIRLPDVSHMLVCGVKSFLHLLQLY